MGISKDLLNYVSDGDLNIVMENVAYSTNLREVVTIGYMIDHQES
jgi:hypothetical protein